MSDKYEKWHPLDSDKLCDGEYGREIRTAFGFAGGMNSCDVSQVFFTVNGRSFSAVPRIKMNPGGGECKLYLEIHEWR